MANGSLRASFDAEQKIELLEFHIDNHDEYISRKMVIERAMPAHNWVKDWHKVNSADTKQSPEISKKGKSKVMRSPQNPPPDLDLPDSAVKHKMGITEAVFQFLEVRHPVVVDEVHALIIEQIVEVMGQMNVSSWRDIVPLDSLLAHHILGDNADHRTQSSPLSIFTKPTLD